MRDGRWRQSAGMTLLAVLVGGYTPANAEPEYRLAELPDIAALALNDHGVVVGNTIGLGASRPAIWDSANGTRLLETRPIGNGGGIAFAINNAGEIAGTVSTDDQSRAVWWDADGLIHDAGILEGAFKSDAQDINDAGTVIGYSDFGSAGDRAQIWDAIEGVRELGSPTTPLPASQAWAINNIGQITGNVENESGVEQATLYDPADGLRDLGVLNHTDERSRGQDINDSGVIVGEADRQPFIWDAGNGMRDLGELQEDGRGNGTAQSINNAGIVVGYSDYEIGLQGVRQEHAFVWDEIHGMRDLNDLLDESGDNWILNRARQINNHGQIIVHGELLTPNGGSRTALLTPLSLIPPLVLGDMDGNGVLDAFDVDDFEQALSRLSEYVAANPGLDPVERGDFNGDGFLDAFDVAFFEAALASGGATVPEPATALLLAIGLSGALRREKRARAAI